MTKRLIIRFVNDIDDIDVECETVTIFDREPTFIQVNYSYFIEDEDNDKKQNLVQVESILSLRNVVSIDIETVR